MTTTTQAQETDAGTALTDSAVAIAAAIRASAASASVRACS